MKRFLLFFWVLLLTVGASKAETYTIFESKGGSWTGDANGYTATQTVNEQDFVITIAKAGSTNNCVSPTQYDQMRVYKNATLTISCETVTITKITLTCNSNSSAGTITDTSWNVSKSGDVLTLTNTSGANSVTYKTSGGQNQITKIEVEGAPKAQDTRTPATVTFGEVPSELNVGDEVTVTATVNDGLTVTYTSSAPEVATVDENSGLIKAIAAGEVTITATSSDNDTYKSSSISFTFSVVDVNAPVWKLLTDATQLAVGSQIIITNVPANGVGKAMSTTSSDNNRGAIDATFNSTGDELTHTNDMLILEVGGENDKWTLKTTNYVGTDGYIVGGYRGNNYCKVLTEDGDGWKITITDGATTVYYNGDQNTSSTKTLRSYLRYNGTSTGNLFSCYEKETSQDAICIYVKSPRPATEVFHAIGNYEGAGNEVTLTIGKEATVTFEVPDNHEVYYCVKEPEQTAALAAEESENPHAGYTLYDAQNPPVIKEACTFTYYSYHTVSKQKSTPKTVTFYGTTTGIESIEADGTAAEYFNLQGVRVAQPERGIYIMRRGNKTAKVVR